MWMPYPECRTRSRPERSLGAIVLLLRREFRQADPCGNDHVECKRALRDSTGSRRPAALCQNGGVDGGELPASLLAEVTELAGALVDAGRFVPGMSVVDGTGIRSWW